MSVRWLTWVWEDAPDNFTGERLLVLLALADTAHDSGELWMSRKHLAAKARCSEEYVRRTLRELESLNLLTVVEAGRRGRATVYQLHRKAATTIRDNTVVPIAVETPTTVVPNSDADSAVRDNSEPIRGNSVRSHPSSTSVVPANAGTETAAAVSADDGDAAAKAWWERQNPRPIGKGAWHSLLAVCRAAHERGFARADIEAALDSIGCVPSIQQMDKILRQVQPRWNDRQSARQQRLQRGGELVRRLAPTTAWELEA